jgi:hypothetical protein
MGWVVVQNWLEELKALPWWDTETAWGKKSDPIWFVKPDDTEGYFLVDSNDTYVVYPELSYQIDDQWYDGSWWLETGTQVELHQIGKWQFIYGLRGPSVPRVESKDSEDIGIQIEGGWGNMPDSFSKFWQRTKPVITQAKNFNQHLARKIGLLESEVWVFASELTTYNLGLSIIPTHGRINTYEMSNLEVATADPNVVSNKYSPTSNFRKVGVGMSSLSYSTSGNGGSHPLNDEIFEAMVSVINKPIRTPDSLLKAMETFSLNLGGSDMPKELRQVMKYLLSPKAKEHFQCLQELGYSVALIPLGGRTIWSPRKD